ncbi:hypothetical protein GCM10023334_049640 [Nonomuraea thailandensis]
MAAVLFQTVVGCPARVKAPASAVPIEPRPMTVTGVAVMCVLQPQRSGRGAAGIGAAARVHAGRSTRIRSSTYYFPGY